MAPLEFEKINNPNAREFKGYEFPIAYKVKTTSKEPSQEEILQLLLDKSSSGFFSNALAKNGAILIRGLGRSDPESLSKYIKTISLNSSLKYFEQNGTVAQRHEITDVLSTANEGPPTNTLYQHNEFSRFIDYPTTLFFVCSKYNAEGGDTPIVHGGELFNYLQSKEPELMKELGERGVYFKQTWPLISENNTSWRDIYTFGRNLDHNSDFESQKKQAAEVVIDRVSPKYEWDGENNLVVHQFTKAIKLYNNGDETFPVFFNSLPTFYANIKQSSMLGGRTSRIKYGDSDTDFIPSEFLDLILDASVKLQYNHQWEEGDVVIVNNYLASHGRHPWKNGDRKILVSMWDVADKGEFADWEGN